MDKPELIKKIKGIIHEWGSFTSAELEKSHPPVLSTNGNTRVLMERFTSNYIDITTYVDGKAVADDSVSYEDLERKHLDDVLKVASEFDAISWRNQEFLNDYDY